MIDLQLAEMGVAHDGYEIIRDKSGVIVARVHSGADSFVLKCFEDPDSRREISNYRLLVENGVRTLEILAATGSAILMEDVSRSEKFRLGMESDMADPDIARALARWYRSLHAISGLPGNMYDESDFFTMENIAMIKERTRGMTCASWDVLENNFGGIKAVLDSLPRVATYNDFYYTNLAVARNKTEAFMFDYNLLGRGCAFSDVRNVTSSLSPEAARAFTDVYGATDPAEQLADDVVSPVIALFMACRREKFPAWAEDCLKILETDMLRRIQALLSAVNAN